MSILDLWLSNGFLIGNHSLTHQRPSEIGLENYLKGISDAEPVLVEAQAKYGQRLQFYRHPYLHTGHTQEVKTGIADYLRSHGYRVAPVTIYNEDWAFAEAMVCALRKWR